MKWSCDKQILFLSAALVLLLLVTANQWGVLETSEARYAEISREMVVSNDWLHPTLLEIQHYHKPPFTYWLTAASYSIMGVTPFSTRFFLAIAFGLQVLLVFNISRLLFKNERPAFFSAVVYATLPLVLISVRGLTTDAYLGVFVLLSLYGWIQYQESGRVIFLYIVAVSLGLGFMTKGPAVFVVPFFVVISFWKRIPWMPMIGALAVFCVVGLSWYAYVIAEDPKLVDYLFFHHMIDRVAHAEMFTRREPWYYYLPILPLVTIPWIFVFVGGLFKKNLASMVKRIVIMWLLLPLVIFSISSSKLVLYILPLSIGFSLSTGYFLDQGVSKNLRMIYLTFIVLIYIALVGVLLSGQGISTNLYLFVVPSIGLLVTLAVWISKSTRERAIPLGAIVLAATLILYASVFFRVNSMKVNGVTPVATFIRQNRLNDRNIIVYDQLLPSLAFELQKDIISVYAHDRSLLRETQFEHDVAWKNFLIDTRDGDGMLKFQTLLSEKSVVVSKKDIPIVFGSSWQRKEIGKWIVYFTR